MSNEPSEDEIFAVTFPHFTGLPNFILKHIYNLLAPCHSYFVEKLPYLYEAITAMPDENKRVTALIELEVEANALLMQYHDSTMDFVYGFEDWVASHKPTNQTDVISSSEIYLMFFSRYSDYREIPSQLVEDIAKLKAKIEVQVKYHVKVSKKDQPNLQLDIKREFSKLFVSPEIENGFIQRLKDYDYITADEKWKGVSGNPGELREAYLVLKSLDLLVPGKQTLKSLKIFYKRFGLIPEEPGAENPFISERALRNKNSKRDHDELMPILKSLANPKR